MTKKKLSYKTLLEKMEEKDFKDGPTPMVLNDIVKVSILPKAVHSPM